MISLFLWDDATARLFAPFALTRPVSELRAGASLIRERWERLFGVTAGGFVGSPRLDDFDEAGAPPAATLIPAGAVIVNSRCIPALDAASRQPSAGDDRVTRWSCGDRLAAVRLSVPVTADTLRAQESLEVLAASSAAGDPAAATAVALDGRWVDAPWELIATLDAQLTEDIVALAPTIDSITPGDAIVLGEHDVIVERGAGVEPMVCLDATAGPILIRRGATVACFSRIVGPCVVGEDSAVLGGRVASAAIGERCKVHGEVSHTIFLGYSNKGHDGFVGHSYIGRWVNLGAGTITSNLKNTYGPVSIWTPLGMRDTGQQFLGTLFGDHAKTAIGTRLSTGTVLGAGANVFGIGMPPRAVSPFAWGDGDPCPIYDVERFLVVAERVMARRGVVLGERARRQLRAAHGWREDAAGS
ncbi:MAG: putative sugar nucleotidyl transferase [Gemmatimonadaceae bacterium]